MDFSLSNSLTSNAVSNPDKLALDLQFAADKTLTARKGPTPVFTRGSGATFVDSDGVIKYAPENLILQSEDFTQAVWTKTNVSVTGNNATDPNGGSTADSLLETTATGLHRVQISPSQAAGTYCFSAYAKSINGRGVNLELTTGSAGAYVNFDLQNVTVLASGVYGTTFTIIGTPTITSVGNGWFRVSLTATTPASFLSWIQTLSANNSSYAGDVTKGVQLWGAQLERSSSARTYIPTTTAAVYDPRFDHDPVTLASKGLLIEESRTNLVIQSEDFGTSWSTDGGKVAVSTNVIASPSGAVTADKITENSILLERKILIGSATAVTATVYTFSCYLKAGEINFAQLAFGGIFGNQYQNFIIGGASAGTLGSGSGVTSPQITALPNGWYRCTATVTSAGSGSTQITIGPLDSSTALKWAAYIGTVGSGIYAWGAQLEAGLFPTSYIPTTTASVVRSADVCSISGSAFSGFYNPLEGSFATSQIFNAPATITTGQVVFDVNDTTTLNRTRLLRNATTGTAGYSNTVGGTQNAAIIGSTSITANQIAKLSCCMKTNDFAVYLNNASQGTDVICTMQAAPTTLTIGDVSTGATRAPINGTISSLRYYKKRLSDAKLVTLTT